jgi:FKBP-type peptidyl-prolyl cis-trans isomerase
MPYKLFASTEGRKLNVGHFVKVEQIIYLNDSLMFDSHGKLPLYFRIDSTGRPYDPSEIFSQLKVGDSIVTVQLIDTFMKRYPGQVPPIYKKGDKIITHYTVKGSLPVPGDYLTDLEKEKQIFLEREIKELGVYLEKNNIEARKTEMGTFVHVKDPGTGPEVDSGKYVTVNYTGRLMDGKIFDSNTTDSFGHKQPLVYGVDISPMGVIGLPDGMKLLKQGGKADIYIPSMLAYAAIPPGGSNIPPFAKLVFEVEILKVDDKAPPEQRNPQAVDSTHQH